MFKPLMPVLSIRCYELLWVSQDLLDRFVISACWRGFCPPLSLTSFAYSSHNNLFCCCLYNTYCMCSGKRVSFSAHMCHWTINVSVLRDPNTEIELAKAALGPCYGLVAYGTGSNHVTPVTTNHTGYMIAELFRPISLPWFQSFLTGSQGWKGLKKPLSCTMRKIGFLTYQWNP